MTLWVLALIVGAACVFCVCWWGTNIVLHPPSMSRMTAFPEQFGLPYERVKFPNSDGLTLSGWWIPSPNEGETRTIVMCHGWGDNKGELLRETAFLNQTGGFNLFYFDTRSHGDSEGDITTIGYLETLDLKAALKHLKETKPEFTRRLGIFGFSMGAAVASMVMPAHPELKAGVLESPFTIYKRVVARYAWNNMRVPYFPLVMFSLWLLRFRVASEIDSYSPAKFIAAIAPRPLLIIGGADDRLMTEGDVRDLHGLAKDPKTLWIIPGAGHGRCRELAGLEYETRVCGFFNRHL